MLMGAFTYVYFILFFILQTTLGKKAIMIINHSIEKFTTFNQDYVQVEAGFSKVGCIYSPKPHAS